MKIIFAMLKNSCTFGLQQSFGAYPKKISRLNTIPGDRLKVPFYSCSAMVAAATGIFTKKSKVFRVMQQPKNNALFVNNSSEKATPTCAKTGNTPQQQAIINSRRFKDLASDFVYEAHFAMQPHVDHGVPFIQEWFVGYLSSDKFKALTPEQVDITLWLYESLKRMWNGLNDLCFETNSGMYEPEYNPNLN